MLIAQINGLGKVTPIDPGSTADFRSASKLSRPSNSQKGKAWIRINMLNNIDLNDILEIVVIGLHPLRGKLIAQKKSLLKGQEIEVYFDEDMEGEHLARMSEIIYPGGGIVGFSSLELSKMNELNFQRKVAEVLIDFMITDQIEKIKGLALPSLHLSVDESPDHINSQLCGLPKFGFQKVQPRNNMGQPLFHLATFMTKEITEVYNQYTHYELLKRVSFYIDINNTDQGWPVESDRFKVITYNSFEENIPASTNYEEKKKVSFYKKLDFPGPGHSSLEKLSLSAEEKDRYKAFHTTFTSIISEIETFPNKLFGYPDIIANCISFEAERIFNRKAYTHIDWDTANNWMLLLQVSPSEDSLNFFDQFGRGIIYFMIKRSDLKRGYFDDVQVVIQSVTDNN